MPEKTRARQEERVALMGLNVILDSIGKHSKPLEGRMAHDAYALRGLRAAETSIKRALTAVMDTMEQESLEYIVKNSRIHEVVVRPRQIVKDPSWMYAKTSDMEVVLAAAMESECDLCMRDGGAVKRCKLRKAMLNLVDEPEADFGCGYRMGMQKDAPKRAEKE